MNTLDNPYVSAILSLALLIYAGVAAPRLPPSVTQYLDYSVVRFAIFFAVAYFARSNPTVALISAIAVLVTLQTLSAHKYEAKMNNAVSQMKVHEGEVNLFDSQDGAIESISPDKESQIRNQDFRDSFYPQVVDMDPSAYEAKDNQSELSGYDAADNYASI